MTSELLPFKVYQFTLKMIQKIINIWVLRPFQENCTYIEPIVNQSSAKTRVPREKTPELLVQNLAFNMCPKRGSNHSSERSNVSELALLLDHRGPECNKAMYV